MERSIKDKVIVITGGAIGIGHEIADSFLKNGAKVVIILDINEEDGTEAIKRLTTKYGIKKVVFMKCDVTKDLNTIPQHIIDKYETVDVLVNNAGINDDADWKKTLDVNAISVVGWAAKFWEHMRKDKGGKCGTIVNIASVFGFKVLPFWPVYQASKFAVLGFTRSIGHPKLYEETGVRVIAICPGFTRTKLAQGTSSTSQDKKPLHEDMKKILATEKWQNMDVMGTGALEIFERADSGSVWVVDGGKVELQKFDNYYDL